MKDSLLVTLADKNFINQAKQLFSSVYWNAGWKGDYMLLTPSDTSEKELTWFRKKSILIKKCRPLYNNPIGSQKHPPIVLSKFYLFTQEFKKWKKIVFLDADIIVRASIDELKKTNHFLAPEATKLTLKTEFNSSNKRLYNQLNEEIKLNGPAFNTGVFSFDTSIIKEDTFSKLMHLFHKYGPLSHCGEEPTLNLYFYKRWKMLPLIYNAYPRQFSHTYHIAPEKMRASIIHFVCSKKPWTVESEFNKEWLYNLKRADLIDLKKRAPPKEVWSRGYIQSYLKWLESRRIRYILINYLDKQIGKVGLAIKHISPNAHRLIKKILGMKDEK